MATAVLPVSPALAGALEALDVDAPLAERLDAVEDLARWIIDPGGLARLRRPEPLQLSRLRELLEALEARPDLARRLAQTLGSIFKETTAVALFADAGIPGDRGIVGETVERLARRILPQAPDDENLERLVSRLFRKPRDCAWIAAAPVEMFAAIGRVLGDVWEPIRSSMQDAVALLCARVSAFGLSAALRDLSEITVVRDSPFFRLPFLSIEEMPLAILECRRQLALIHERLETSGVSVDVVYRVDTIRRMLARLELILPLVERSGTPAARTAAAQSLLAALTSGRIADQSVRQLGRQNLGLLARKVIERVGHTGEHYVTSTRREYLQMLVSAAGGGALTALTVVGKFLAKWAHFAPFIDAMITSGVYAASFLAMQFLGLTLATKQPSMTAAALAATLREVKGKHQLDDIVGLIARMSRSQFAAAVGNVFTVIPVVVVIDLLVVQASGHHFLDAKASATTIASFDPLHSGTIFYAALTGVLLWLSSLGAGWLENWVTYRRLPEAIRHHRLGRFAGRRSLARVADFLVRQSAGIGGSVTLGFLLGITPVLGNMLGLPLDVRHVTLSTGSLAFSACSLGAGAVPISACIGIALIGLLNFGVSFAFALAIALRAREVTNQERIGLAVAVLGRFLRHPLEFFVPTKASATEPKIALDSNH